MRIGNLGHGPQATRLRQKAALWPRYHPLRSLIPRRLGLWREKASGPPEAVNPLSAWRRLA